MKASDYKKISSLYPGRWDQNYVASKLRTDPLYQAVWETLAGSELPLLDLGCGLGLTAFFLRCEGCKIPITGMDYDARKIDTANQAASVFGNEDLTFIHHDLRDGMPAHSGNVCILDILQFFDANQQEVLLKSASARISPGGKLIIRSGLRDDSLRFKITVLGDLLAKATRWMKSGPTHYPSAGDFHRILSPFGKVTITPLWGGTPFNNHLIVMELPG
jgi:2-polyprenyl-3-methyl-5-hydroxy-6-metoxy-1,4-benzoquinol methylase